MAERRSRLETDFGKQWGEVRISDTREWHEVYGRCRLCERRSVLDRAVLARVCGRQALLVDVQTRLRCTVCRNRVANTIEVERMSRN